MRTLSEIYEGHSSPEGFGDKGTLHTYIEIYEKLLNPYRHNSSILEIGLYHGQSLRMWNEYFIDSKIYGVDIIDRNFGEMINDEKFNIFIADATQKQFLNLIEDLTFDIIIDDGSHLIRDQISSFLLLKNKIKSGGLYIIEDIDNIDSNRNIFENLHDNVEIIDNRHIKNRFDDVLIIYKF